jgi:hypothetical protein
MNKSLRNSIYPTQLLKEFNNIDSKSISKKVEKIF